MRTHVSRVYPAALIDLYDREVIGYKVPCQDRDILCITDIRLGSDEKSVFDWFHVPGNYRPELPLTYYSHYYE